MSNLSEFVARELREPTPEEMAEIQERDRQDALRREADRHEGEIRRAYMSQPGADEAGWQRDRADVLSESRKQATLRQHEEARRSQAALYRSF